MSNKKEIFVGIDMGFSYEGNADQIAVWQEDGKLLIDHISEESVADLVDFLTEFQNRPKTPYFLWEGNNGTIISALTREEDLPSITIGGGGKREKFMPITNAFYKDEKGNFFK